MIKAENKRFLIDGKPQIILSGEVHYFRLRREEWEDRIRKLKLAGCNAVASYVPWICHEPKDGQMDLTGTTRPELDLEAFVNLCEQNGLYVFLRPGPFIMAEMKNEGIPFWVYEKHPEIVPVTWDGKKTATRTVDYLAPGFLQEVRKWYGAVMPLIAKHLPSHGGKVIGVQLDNEIGMLSWISNSPDLTDHVLADFVRWLNNRYKKQELAERYPFPLERFAEYAKAIRSPREDYATYLLHDLGYYMRNRFARYAATLRSYAGECGVREIPFFLNIHGTAGGRGLTYPIGVSQLFEAYTQKEGYASGSDIYLGDLTMNNFQDLYMINAFTDSVNTKDQPLTSLEFECGDGNYGSTLGGRYDPSAVDFKTRMCIAQGNRMLNYYLFAGGSNYVMDPKPKDGNGRIAFTGQRHGFAAPISPEGGLNYTFPRMARTIRAVRAVSDKLADMEEEHDDVAFAFLPDYYMTENHYPGSARSEELVRNLEQRRSGSAWEIVARAMLLANYRFGAVDIQSKALHPKDTACLVVLSAKYMSPDVQRNLAEYLAEGGNLFLYGELPLYDMEGGDCTILADALSVKPLMTRYATETWFLSVYADGWAAPRPEIRAQYAQAYRLEKGEAILRIAETEEVCGFEGNAGNGRAIVLGANYDCDIAFFKTILERLGVKPGLVHDDPNRGIFLTSTASENGERFIHLLNLDGFEKEFRLYENDLPLFDGRKITLQPKEGVMLPINITFQDGKIVYSTAEISGAGDTELCFRLTQSSDVICLETSKEILPGDGYTVKKDNGRYYITSLKNSKIEDSLKVYFSSN